MVHMRARAHAMNSNQTHYVETNEDHEKLVESGNLHRDDDQPSIIWVEDGTMEWWRNGNLHRDHGPAFVSGNGHEVHYNKGLLHRLDGPADKDVFDQPMYMIEGKRYTKEEYDQEVRKWPGMGFFTKGTIGS